MTRKEAITETRAEQVSRIYRLLVTGEIPTLDALDREIEAAEERGATMALGAQYLTIKQAATHLRCSREALYNLIRDGRLPFVTSVSGRRLIERKALASLRDTRLEPTKVRLSAVMRDVLTHARKFSNCPKVLLVSIEHNTNRRTIRALLRRNLIEYNGNIGWCLTTVGETVRATLPEVTS